MTLLFDGLDMHGGSQQFLSGLNTKVLNIKREKPFLNSSRYCFPYPVLPFINFVYYPKKFIAQNSINFIFSFKVFPLNKIPWATEVEEFHYLNAFYSYFNKDDFFSRKMNSISRTIIKNALNSAYCKKILCLSDYSRKTVLAFGGKKLEEKTKTCFPAVKCSERKKRKEKDNISLLFVATNPVYKGTDFVFSAFKELKKKYDVELNCFGNFSEETKKQFPEINFGFVSGREFSEKVLPENDILLMPSLIESFGFTILEAFSNSVPVISSDIMAFPEINQDNQTGYLINFPKEYHKKIFSNPYCFSHKTKKLNKNTIVFQLIEKSSLLIEDSSLRKKFGKNAFNEVNKGKFSLRNRQNKLRDIFPDLF